MSNQLQLTGGAKVRNLQDVIIGTSGVLSSLAFNVANGVPKLDSNGKILVSQLPNSVMEYKGTWNAATNTPTLVNGTGNQGDVYLCNVAGTVDFGAGPIAFVVGDQVIYSGSIWQRASGATGTVTSVAITESGDSLNITGSPITTSGTINIGFNGTNLQYVNGAGNLTTFPILTGYVPYTGATQDVDLGAFKLNAQSLHIKGTGGLGHLGLKHQSASATAAANEASLFADTLGDLSWLNGNLYLSKFITSGNTAARSYTFPNANGTVALTSDLTGYLTAVTATSPLSSSGGTTPNITIAQATTSANGYLSSTDWNTFNNKQAAITLTTTGSSGVSTLVGATLNIPDYGSALTGYVTLATTQTITGAKTFSGYTTFTSTVDITSGLTFSNSGFTLVLQPPTLSVNRTVTFADITGTIAMLEGTQTFTGYKTFDAALELKYNVIPTPSSAGNIGIGSNGVGITITTKPVSTVYNNNLYFASASNTFTFPNATGTIALVGGSGVGTVTSVAALTIGTSGTDVSSTVATGTTTPVITLNVPTASATNRGALSSADWTTFNGKQAALTIGNIFSNNTTYLTVSGGTGAIIGSGVSVSIIPSAIVASGLTLTTTGTSGAATFSSNTLNIPNYGSALSGYLPLTGGTLTGALSGTSATFSSSVTAGGLYLTNLTNANTTTALFTNGASDGNFKSGFANGSGTTVASEQAKIGMWYGTSGTPLVHIGFLRGNSADSIGMTFNVNNAECMRLNSAGNVGIGTTSPSEKLQVNGNVLASGFFESSDSRLKTLIQDNYQTKGIAAITPKLYTKNGKVELGYYAQDFVGILDSAVSKGSDDMLSLSYREIHTAKIYALEQEIKELKAKMN